MVSIRRAMGHHDTVAEMVKLAIAWLSFLIAWITLQKVALVFTTVYTGLNIYITIRKIRRNKDE